MLHAEVTASVVGWRNTASLKSAKRVPVHKALEVVTCADVKHCRCEGISLPLHRFIRWQIKVHILQRHTSVAMRTGANRYAAILHHVLMS